MQILLGPIPVFCLYCIWAVGNMATFFVKVKKSDPAKIFLFIFIFENNSVNFGCKDIAWSILIISDNLIIKVFLSIKAIVSRLAWKVFY